MKKISRKILAWVITHAIIVVPPGLSVTISVGLAILASRFTAHLGLPLAVQAFAMIWVMVNMLPIMLTAAAISGTVWRLVDPPPSARRDCPFCPLNSNN